MVATMFHNHHHYVNESKTSDIFEQTVTIDKPLSSHFYDHLQEVTIDAEIVVGRKGIVEEIVPLEQWASVISKNFTATPEEDWVIEPEEVVYTVVKWEGVEGGEKHVVENKQWKEVAHTPPIHTKHHVSPLTNFNDENNGTKFSFSNEEIHSTQSNNVGESNNQAELTFEKSHASASADTTWHSSSFHSATHKTSESTNNIGHHNENGHTITCDDPLQTWRTVNREADSTVKEADNNSTISSSYQSAEHNNVWHKTHVSQPQRPPYLANSEEITATPLTKIPKPRISPSAYTKTISPESPKQIYASEQTKMVSPKIILKTNGNTVFSNRYSPQPSPPAASHQFIAAKPASHTTFMRTSYTSNSTVSSPEQVKSPPRTPGTPEKVTWRRTHGNQYVRETI